MGAAEDYDALAVEEFRKRGCATSLVESLLDEKSGKGREPSTLYQCEAEWMQQRGRPPKISGSAGLSVP